MTVIDRAGDVDEFTRLKADQDPRTIEQMKAEDEYQEGVVTSATLGEHGWSLGWREAEGGSYGCGCPAKDGVEIKPGDTIRVYGQGFGYTFHGIDINGVEMFWRTPWERFAERVKWLAEHDRHKRERFVSQRAELDAKYDALSPMMKARIDRFRSESPDFRIDSEAYEMVACVDADKIARHLKPRVDAGEDPEVVVKEFYDLPWEEQRKLGLDEGHSGNTFGGACRLACGMLAGSFV